MHNTAQCDICLFWICWQVAHVHCEKVDKANTLSSVGFGSSDEVQSSNTDKKQAASRHFAPCGKLKCQTRKNLCIAYTQVNTHAHFFSPSLCVFFFSQWKSFTQKTHISGAVVSPLTRRRLKFISLTPDKPAPALSGTGSGVIKDPDAIEATVPFQEKRRGTHSNLSRGAHTHARTHMRAHKCTPESTLTNSLTSCG